MEAPNIPNNSLTKEIKKLVKLCEKSINEYGEDSSLFRSPTPDSTITKWEEENNIKLPTSYLQWIQFTSEAKIRNNLAFFYNINNYLYNEDDISDDLIVIISDTNANSGIISSDEFASNVILNVVNVGTGSFSNNIDAVAQATGGEVYNAISANDLTYESGELIYTPEQFIGTDSDGDGIPDLVELYGLKPNGTPLATDPNNVDTDGDGINDNVELNYLPGGLVYPLTQQQLYMMSSPSSDPNKMDSDGDGLDDALDDFPLDASSHHFLVYETKNTDEYLHSCKSGNEGPNDYRYSDKTQDELRELKFVNWSDFIQTKGVFEEYIKIMAKNFAYDDMDNVIVDMFDYFYSGKGGDYTNPLLTHYARNHEDSERYINETTAIINEYIETHNGDIKSLKYNEHTRDSSYIVSNMKEKVNPPTFEDKFGGLGICVDGTYGNQFEITSYKVEGNSYEYTIKYTIYLA